MKTSKEQIFRAAERLIKSGDKPTLAAVRRLLGGGSYTSIQEGLSEWKANQAAKKAASEAAPTCIAERLGAFGIEIWRLATEQAAERLKTEREGLEQTRAALEVERLEAAALADQLSAEVEQLKAQLAEQTRHAQTAALQASEQLSQAREMLATAREEAVQAKGELAGVRSLYSELLARLPKAKTPSTQAGGTETAKAKPAKKPKPVSKTKQRPIAREQPLPF